MNLFSTDLFFEERKQSNYSVTGKTLQDLIIALLLFVCTKNRMLFNILCSKDDLFSHTFVVKLAQIKLLINELVLIVSLCLFLLVNMTEPISLRRCIYSPPSVLPYTIMLLFLFSSRKVYGKILVVDLPEMF